MRDKVLVWTRSEPLGTVLLCWPQSKGDGEMTTSVGLLERDTVADEPTTRDRIQELDLRIADTETQRRRDFSETTKSLGRIEDFVENTNGRVKKLELWRSGIAGALAILIPLVLWLLKVAAEYGAKKVLGP